MSIGSGEELFKILEDMGIKIHKFKFPQNNEWIKKAVRFPGRPPRVEMSRVMALETDQLLSKDGSHSLWHQSTAPFLETFSNPAVHSQELEITWDIQADSI